jgi:integrase/recombinase XerD
MTVPTVTSLLQGFFTERLVRQLHASAQTVSAYRDTIKLLLMFAAQKTKKAPSRLAIDDLDAVTVGAFLSYLDNERHNSTATHNARLAAIHSFYRYALPLIPDRAHTASQVLAIPQRRHDRAIVSYLTSLETDALLAAPDCTTWYGRRDHALLLTTVQTGLRVSEVTGLTIQDITTTTPGAAVHTTGKPQRTRHPADTADRGRPTRLAARGRARAQRPSVPDAPGNPDVCRRCSTARRQTRHRRRIQLPVDQLQARHPSHPEAYRGDDAAARRRRHIRYRPVAGPPKPGDHPHLSACRHDHQGTCPGPRPREKQHPRPLPAR